MNLQSVANDIKVSYPKEELDGKRVSISVISENKAQKFLGKFHVTGLANEGALYIRMETPIRALSSRTRAVEIVGKVATVIYYALNQVDVDSIERVSEDDHEFTCSIPLQQLVQEPLQAA
jgi:hypothetical protein